MVYYKRYCTKNYTCMTVHFSMNLFLFFQVNYNMRVVEVLFFSIRVIYKLTCSFVQHFLFLISCPCTGNYPLCIQMNFTLVTLLIMNILLVN